MLWSILKRLGEFARPYRGLFILTLILTVLGSFTAQVNAFVLQYTIDTLTNIVDLPDPWVEGIKLLTLISVILLVKEVLNVIITFGQRYFGERIRINLSRDLSQKVVDRILSYKMAFYTSDENASGKLQTRIDLGVSSLTQLVQNFFIDMLPLFASAIVSLIIMFNANFWVGMVGLIIVPIYFLSVSAKPTVCKGFANKCANIARPKAAW